MSTTASLYDIAEMRDVLDTWLLESDGELTPELEQLLAEIDGQADAKIERVALYIRGLLVEAKAVKEEEDRLSARRKARERAAESLKSYLTQQMQRLGKLRVEGLLATVAFQKNPPAVRGDLTPAQLAALYAAGVTSFIRHAPESFTLDRRAALEAWKADGELPPGLSVEQTHSLRIR